MSKGNDIQHAKEQAAILRAAKDRVAVKHSELMVELQDLTTAASRISASAPSAYAHRILMRTNSIREKLNMCDFGGLVSASTKVADFCEDEL